MEIRQATKEDLQQLYEFNHRMYPERTNSKEIIDYWLSRHSDAISDIVVCVDENKVVRGQQFFCRMSYYYNGTKIDSSWPFDLIVDNEIRARAGGLALMRKSLKIHPNPLGSGSNDTALTIELRIGYRKIGTLRKYAGITNPFYVALSPFKNKKIHFPSEFISNETTFRKVDEKRLNDVGQAYNKQLLEISRDKDFLKWKFFSPLHEYGLYSQENSNNFFAVRIIQKKHIAALVLIDYRCDLSTQDSFKKIFRAFKHLANTLHIGVIIVGSSLTVVDKVCEQSRMKNVGRERPIIGILKCNDRQHDIEDRNFVLWTFADSDGDTTL